MYYRVPPNMTDWMVLILMKLLHIINQMYKDKKAVALLEDYCSNQIRDNYGKAHYYWLRTQRFVMGAIIYLILVFMVSLQYWIEQNIINWVFWTFNILNFALMIRGSKQIKYLQQSLFVTQCNKLYALTILIADIIFIVFLGELQKPVNYVNTLDIKLKTAYPDLYKNLDLIGFRSQNPLLQKAQASLTAAEIQTQKEMGSSAMEARFIAYVAFFLFSCYLAIYFKAQIATMRADQGWTEEDYKKLFEFKMQKPKMGDDQIAGLSMYNDDFKEEDLEHVVFRKKHEYHFQDLIDYYEK